MKTPPDAATRHEALGSAIDRATRHVPFYSQWRERDPGNAVPIGDRLAALPVLTKKDLRSRSHVAFVPTDRIVNSGIASGDVEIVTTSGTTEDRVSIVWNQPWWDFSERESLLLNSQTKALRPGLQREAVLTTPLCAAAVCHVGDLPLEQRILGRLLFLNQKVDPAYWTEADIARMAGELNDFEPEVLEADPAYLAQLCYRACAAGISLFQPAHILLTYEFPSRLHLRQVRRAFRAKPISSYGSTETGHVFTQCEQGLFHQNTATCHVDFVPLTRPAAAAAIGKLLVTTIGNEWFSLVRFDVGDLARIAGEPCPCGRRGGLTLESIEGRIRDVTFATDGSVVTVNSLDRAMDGVEGMLAYQVEQAGHAAYLLKFVAEPGQEQEAARRGALALRQVYGEDAVVDTLRETAIVPEPSGKYCLSRARFPWDQQALFC